MVFELTARNLTLSHVQHALIREQAERLRAFYGRITGCRVAVEVPHRRMDEPVSYQVRVDLTVPGDELVVTRQVGDDLLTAVQEAFEAARRRLQDYARVRRGDVKTSQASPHARVSKLFPLEGYGFLETPDGREIYFHANAVLNGAFKNLGVGTRVRYAAEMGEDGPQASTVAVVGRRRGAPVRPP